MKDLLTELKKVDFQKLPKPRYKEGVKLSIPLPKWLEVVKTLSSSDKERVNKLRMHSGYERGLSAEDEKYLKSIGLGEYLYKSSRVRECKGFKKRPLKEALNKEQVFFCPSCKEFGYDYGEGFQTPDGKPSCLTCDKEMQPVQFDEKQRAIWNQIEELEDEAMGEEMGMDSLAARDPHPGQEDTFKKVHSGHYSRMEAAHQKAEKLTQDLIKSLGLKEYSGGYGAA